MSLKESRRTLKLLLDSSFLFIPSQFKIDIFEELASTIKKRFEPIILSPTYKELQKIAKSGPLKIRRQAAFALAFAQKCQQIDVEKSDYESPDDVIVRVATELGCPVATNDQALRKKLRYENLPVIYLRQKSHLAIEGSI